MMRAVTKSGAAAAFGNDTPPVDTNPAVDNTIGNDKVDTKHPAVGGFDNDGTIGFVRVRKRKLKGGHPDWRRYRAARSVLTLSSASYDLVKAERVNGMPRHKFILGLGSLKERPRENDVIWFWARAFQSMRRHGLTKQQGHHVASALARKGVDRITPEHCAHLKEGWPFMADIADEIMCWLSEAEAS
jgi:hypothetical protein